MSPSTGIVVGATKEERAAHRHRLRVRDIQEAVLGYLRREDPVEWRASTVVTRPCSVEEGWRGAAGTV